MRIFVLLSRIPWPLEKGDKLRAWHQIRELSKNNEIILCALNPVGRVDKQQAFASLQPYCRSINFIDLPWTGRIVNILRSLFTGLPFQVGYFYNRKAARQIRKLIRLYKPDHLYCQLIRTAEYIADQPIPKTIDFQDVFSYGMKRRIRTSGLLMKPVVMLEYSRLARYEHQVFDRFDHRTIISVPDRDLIPHPDREQISIILNGVDHDFFSPRKAQKDYDIVFTGNMAYPPNVDAAQFLVKEIMPRVWKQLPEAKVLLAGASPDHKVSALAGPGVKVSGWMDDIREAYAGSKVFIAPMRLGTGLQNKLLEAMAMKLPAITTTLANNALQANHGKDILVGDTAADLAEAIITLLTDQEKHQELAAAGHTFVRSNYHWGEATQKLEALMKGDQ